MKSFIFIISLFLFLECSIVSDSMGRVFVWGRNSYGQLGNSTHNTLVVQSIRNPIPFQAGKTSIKSLCGSYYNTFFLTTSGKVYARGRSEYSGTSTLTGEKLFEPVLVPIPEKVSTLVCGHYSAIAWSKTSGLCYGWGANSNNFFGNGSDSSHVFYYPHVLNGPDVDSGSSLFDSSQHVKMGGFVSQSGIIFYTESDAFSPHFFISGNDYGGVLGGGTSGLLYSFFALNDESSLVAEILSGNALKQIETFGYGVFYLFEDSKVYYNGRAPNKQNGCGDVLSADVLSPVWLNFSACQYTNSEGVWKSELEGKTIEQISCQVDACGALASNGYIYSWGYASEMYPQVGRNFELTDDVNKDEGYVARQVNFEYVLKNTVSQFTAISQYTSGFIMQNSIKNEFVFYLYGDGYDILPENGDEKWPKSVQQIFNHEFNDIQDFVDVMLGVSKYGITPMFVLPVFCFGKYAADPNVCSGRGACIDTDTCECETLAHGDNCESTYKDAIVASAIATSSLTFAVIGVTSLLVCLFFSCMIVLCCFSFFFLIYRNKKKKDKSTHNTSMHEKVVGNVEEEELLEEEGNPNVSINKSLFKINHEDLKLLKVIGEGGSGCVCYKARWKDDIVAIKQYKMSSFEGDKSFSDQFEIETGLMASLNHPHILNCYGLFFNLRMRKIGIVMEYCENSDLQSAVNCGKLPLLEDRIKCAAQISKGMGYLHERNIIHRDLKPGNVLLTKDLVCKIMDFGLSRLASSDGNMTTRIGTSYFMAPELLKNAKYDEKVDVFAYAILLYQLIFKDFHPYGKDQLYGVELKVAADPNFRPDIKKYASVIKNHEFLGDLMRKCWNHESADRPSFDDIRKSFFLHFGERKDEDESLLTSYGGMNKDNGPTTYAYPSRPENKGKHHQKAKSTGRKGKAAPPPPSSLLQQSIKNKPPPPPVPSFNSRKCVRNSPPPIVPRRRMNSSSSFMDLKKKNAPLPPPSRKPIVPPRRRI